MLTEMLVDSFIPNDTDMQQDSGRLQVGRRSGKVVAVKASVRPKSKPWGGQMSFKSTLVPFLALLAAVVPFLICLSQTARTLTCQIMPACRPGFLQGQHLSRAGPYHLGRLRIPLLMSN